MKLLLAFFALLAIAHSAPFADEPRVAAARSIQPIAVDTPLIQGEEPIRSVLPIEVDLPELQPEEPIKSVLPIDGDVPHGHPDEPISGLPIEGGVGYIPAATPNIDITISINGVATPYSQQNLVYIQILTPKQPPQQPPQIAAPGFELVPNSEVFPESGPIFIQ